MARKPKIKPMTKLWEKSDEELSKISDHLSNSFPNSGMLLRYKREMSRRVDNISIEIFYRMNTDEQ